MLIESWLVGPLIVFLLVLARVTGLVMTAPLLMSGEIPLQVRAFLTVTVALLLTPGQLGSPLVYPQDLVALALLFVGELALGMILGLGVMIVLAGVQIAGQIISQLSGMSLADVFNPGFDSEVPLLSHLMYLVTLSAFLLIGGHRQLIGALVHTFHTVPLGKARLPSGLDDMLATLLSESFALGIRAAAPVMVALLLATILLGLISRTIPQINVLVVGFGINSFITLGLTAVSMGVMVLIFQDAFEPAIEQLVELIERPPV
jgi:flagellar biosynthetic protein FliR